MYHRNPIFRVVVHASEATNDSNPQLRVLGNAPEGRDNLKGGLLELRHGVHGAGW